MNDTTRTFRASYLVMTEGVVLSAHNHILTFTGYGADIVATLDGQPCTFEHAEAITRCALSLGRFDRLSGPSQTPTIGKPTAHALHVELARLGHGRGYEVASEVLGRTVTSLAGLTADEAREVWSYACAMREMPTLPSVVYQGVSA